MATQVQTAQIVGNTISYPPQRRNKQKPQFGTVYAFKVDVMRHDPEMFEKITALHEKHTALEAEASQRERAELEAELDRYIEGAQHVDEEYKKIEAEHFAEMTNHQKAKNDLQAANEAHRSLLAESEDEDVLLTRAQKAEREKRFQQSAERVQKANIAESLATTALNSVIQRLNDANRISVAWKAIAREIQAELNDA